MSKFFSNRTSACNLICALLMIILLVLHFAPFWTYGENGENASIQGYVWFPTDHGALEKYIQANADADHNINSILGMPILVLILSAVGAVFCLFKNDQVWTSVFPIACGACGMWGYLTKAAFKLGTNWMLHLIVCIAMLIIGFLSLLAACKELKNG